MEGSLLRPSRERDGCRCIPPPRAKGRAIFPDWRVPCMPPWHAGAESRDSISGRSGGTEALGREWLAHLGATLDPNAPPVAGIPGPAAHLIAGFRLLASESWCANAPGASLSVSAAALCHDAGRLYAVTAGRCRLFRARG